jgi:RAB6A-GEF complex partner protein 1
MYWPVGAPRIYAADNHSIIPYTSLDDTNPNEGTQNDNDSAIADDLPTPGRPRRLTIDTGLANGTQNTSSTDSKQGPSRQETGAQKDGANGDSRNRTRSKSSAETNKPKDEQSQISSAETGVGGEIIAMRPSRSGQFFVTVTRTTVSIWQTKACPTRMNRQD